MANPARRGDHHPAQYLFVALATDSQRTVAHGRFAVRVVGDDAADILVSLECDFPTVAALMVLQQPTAISASVCRRREQAILVFVDILKHDPALAPVTAARAFQAISAFANGRRVPLKHSGIAGQVDAGQKLVAEGNALISFDQVRHGWRGECDQNDYDRQDDKELCFH